MTALKKMAQCLFKVSLSRDRNAASNRRRRRMSCLELPGATTKRTNNKFHLNPQKQKDNIVSCERGESSGVLEFRETETLLLNRAVSTLGTTSSSTVSRYFLKGDNVAEAKLTKTAKKTEKVSKKLVNTENA
jgi:hypothetical protein